jgi:hypothetical protein
MEAWRGNRGIAPLIRNLGWAVHITPGKNPCTHRIQSCVRPQSLDDLNKGRNLLSMPGFEHRTVQVYRLRQLGSHNLGGRVQKSPAWPAF